MLQKFWNVLDLLLGCRHMDVHFNTLIYCNTFAHIIEFFKIIKFKNYKDTDKL